MWRHTKTCSLGRTSHPPAGWAGHVRLAGHLTPRRMVDVDVGRRWSRSCAAGLGFEGDRHRSCAAGRGPARRVDQTRRTRSRVIRPTFQMGHIRHRPRRSTTATHHDRPTAARRVRRDLLSWTLRQPRTWQAERSLAGGTVRTTANPSTDPDVALEVAFGHLEDGQVRDPATSAPHAGGRRRRRRRGSRSRISRSKMSRLTTASRRESPKARMCRASVRARRRSGRATPRCRRGRSRRGRCSRRRRTRPRAWPGPRRSPRGWARPRRPGRRSYGLRSPISATVPSMSTRTISAASGGGS